MKVLLRQLRKLFNYRAKNSTPSEQAVEQTDSTAAHAPESGAPEEVHPGKRNLKQEFTSHWDWDYLPRDKLEKMLPENKKQRHQD